MNIWEIDKALLFLVLVLPGFISIKVYELIIASDKRDFSKSILEAVMYSALNFILLSWLITLISSNNFVKTDPFLYWLSSFGIFIFFPAAGFCPIIVPSGTVGSSISSNIRRLSLYGTRIETASCIFFPDNSGVLIISIEKKSKIGKKSLLNSGVSKSNIKRNKKFF